MLYWGNLTWAGLPAVGGAIEASSDNVATQPWRYKKRKVSFLVKEIIFTVIFE